ncbi:MAG: DNA polymerase I [Anaerolineae bacterium]|nr:DNA polymerase I [Anaerolineae bacterium]
MAERPLMVLIDGHAVAYRAYFALPVEGFSTSAGQPTNAVYGFTKQLMDILATEPTYIAVSFDQGLSGRETLYADYKGTRDKMPEALASQMPHIESIVRAFNIPVLSLPGYEADDVIGTIARQAEDEGCQVLIITGDRDLLQLLSAHTQVRLPNRSRGSQGDDTWDVPMFHAAYSGLQPAQLVDYKGLVGDSSDNIPGVKGIGDKSAVHLLVTYATVEALYEHLPEVETRFRTKLEAGRELAFLSKQLATIQRHVPLQLDLPACLTHDFDGQQVRELFRELEFRSLSTRLEEFLVRRGAQLAEAEHDALAFFIPPHTVVTQPEQLAALQARLATARIIAFDTETTSLDQMRAKLVGISLSADGEHGYYIPVGHINPNVQPSLFGDNDDPHQLPLASVIEALRPAMTDPHIGKVAHNAEYDLIILRRYGLDVAPITEDTMLAEWVHNPSSKFLGLKALAYSRLGIKMQEIEALIGKGQKQITMDRVAIEEAAGYAAADAVVTHKLVYLLRNELSNPQTPRARELYETLELPLIPVLADMEMAGVLIDPAYFAELSAEFGERLRGIEEAIYSYAGQRFNINSLPQLNEVLFEKLKLPTEGLKKSQHGFSLTALVLEELAERSAHPILPLLVEQRGITKLLSTYVDALPALVNPQTGRVHTSFNQTGAVTGRLSSSNPNLQNIPIRTEEGRRVRRGFIAAPGHVLLSVDYSQIELRILAHYSGDDTLRRAFAAGHDIHRTTAAGVYRISPEEVSFEQRRFAKAVNFGLMYGMGAFRLARDSELTLAEAEAFISAYFQEFPTVKEYLDTTRDFVAHNGYVETLFGRRRLFPELTRDDTNRQNRARAEREAINMPIQGTAADIIKKAMIELHHLLKAGSSGARLLLQVHDELMLEVRAEAAEAVREQVVDTMQRAGAVLSVPVVADAKLGQNWAALE